MSNDVFFQEKLESIEKKVDEMGKAILLLARLEERQAAHIKEVTELKYAQNAFFDRLRSIENTQSVSISKLTTGERIMWAVAAAAVSLATWKFKT